MSLFTFQSLKKLMYEIKAGFYKRQTNILWPLS